MLRSIVSNSEPNWLNGNRTTCKQGETANGVDMTQNVDYQAVLFKMEEMLDVQKTPD